MIDSYSRNSFQKFIVVPILRTAIGKLHPVQITCLGLIFGLIGSSLIFFRMPWLASFFILLSGFLDVLDGSVARHRNKQSNLGAMLDLIFDRIIEFSVIYALFLLDPLNRAPLCLLIQGAIYLCVTSFFIVSLFSTEKSEKSFHYSPGLIERTEAFFFFLLLILFPNQFYWIGLSFFLLVCLTTTVRVSQFCKREINPSVFCRIQEEK